MDSINNFKLDSSYIIAVYIGRYLHLCENIRRDLQLLDIEVRVIEIADRVMAVLTSVFMSLMLTIIIIIIIYYYVSKKSREMRDTQ